MADILERKQLLEQHGLAWPVVESVPVHNDIKTRTGRYATYIQNYQQSLENLGKAGINRVCYNFMPVVDWTRTNLNYELPNQAQALRFEMTDFVAYDVYALQRPGAAEDYDEGLLARASERYKAMSEGERAMLETNIIAGLPGGEGSYDRAGISTLSMRFERWGPNVFAPICSPS